MLDNYIVKEYTWDTLFSNTKYKMDNANTYSGLIEELAGLSAEPFEIESLPEGMSLDGFCLNENQLGELMMDKLAE